MKIFKTTLKIGLKYFDRKNPISSNWIGFVWQRYYQYVSKELLVYLKSIFSLYVEIWGRKLKKFFKWPKIGLKWNCKKVRFFQSYSEFSKLSYTKQFVTQFSKVRKTYSASIFFKIEKNWKYFKTTLKFGLKYFDRKNPISSNWIGFVWQRYYQYV